MSNVLPFVNKSDDGSSSGGAGGEPSLDSGRTSGKPSWDDEGQRTSRSVEQTQQPDGVGGEEGPTRSGASGVSGEGSNWPKDFLHQGRGRQRKSLLSKWKRPDREGQRQ